MANAPPPASYFPTFSPQQIRSYLRSLPVFTRLCIVIILVALVLEMQNISSWDILQWGSLIPMEVSIGSMYRLNTFPFLNGGLLHALFNLLAFVPLMERFEADNGTLVSGALFLGPFGTFPAFIYLLIERVIFRGNTAIFGTSIWVFLLLSIEAIKTYRSEPHFALGPYKISTWTYPLLLVILIWIFIPNTSLIGHLCGCAIGYAYGLGYLQILVPPEKILRWIEGKLDLLGRIPHYVSVDQKTFGRYGVLPTSNSPSMSAVELENASAAGRTWVGGSSRLGP